MSENIFYEQSESINIKSDSEKKTFEKITLSSKTRDRKFFVEVEIISCKTPDKKLTFDCCIFDKISIKQESNESIQEIRFKNCEINEISFRGCNGIRIVFESSPVQTISLENCDKSNIRIENSNVQMLSFMGIGEITEVSIAGIPDEICIGTINSNETQINKLKLNHCHVESIYVGFIDLLEIEKGATLDYFYIYSKEELQRFLNILKKRQNELANGSISQKEAELNYQQKILLAAFNQYSAKNKFQEMDACLVRLRRINCRLNRLNTRNLLKKTGYLIENFILGKMFGWGVRIVNSVITASVIIVAFALIYFVALRHSVGNAWQCIQICFESSINRFFNVSEVNPILILEHFDTAEQIIGVIILTIFTGVIARKIIR